MIISKLQGGLGNQLFQWAYGKALSIQHNIDLFLDISYYSNQGTDTKRSYELHKFPKIQRRNKIDNKPIINIIDNFKYSIIDYNNNYSYYLNGYWQSEKYFISHRETILHELQPPNEKYLYLSSLISDNALSLHIRRTDYLTSNGYHPVQDKSYYDNAIDIVGEYSELLIFSDDIQWCKNNLKYKNIKYIENQDNVDDLWLMSLCKNNIIANSSFSWWGAWINNNPNKKVVAPINWFGDKSIDTTNIIPDAWIKT